MKKRLLIMRGRPKDEPDHVVGQKTTGASRILFPFYVVLVL